LSNFQITHIADDIEAFNYLIHRQNSPRPINLLVIVDTDINQPFLQLLGEMERRNALLPILLLRNNGPIPLNQLSSNVKIRNYIKQCDPSVTYFCVRELLEAFTAHRTRVPETIA